MKKISILTILMFLLFSVAAMADVTVATPSTGKTSQGGSFIVNAYSANAMGCEQMKAAPGTGKAIYLKTLFINVASPVTVTIGEGETTPGSVDTILIGPISFSSEASLFKYDFYPALKLTDNKSLTVDSSATAPVVIVIEGFIE